MEKAINSELAEKLKKSKKPSENTPVDTSLKKFH
jgi:hypothetical protein